MTPPDVDDTTAANAGLDLTRPAGTPRAESGPRVRSWTIALALMIVVTMAALFAVAVALNRSGSDGAKGHDVTYYVPSGTGERIDAGESVEIIPTQLTLHVTDTLVLINDDDRTHNVGGYQVRGGDTLRITYPRPGLYMNSCSVNSGALVYVNVVD